MPKREEPETSAFTSQNRESFPPTYEDNKDVRNFSDEKKWPTPKLIGRLAMYSWFVERLDIMPRARRTANRILEHLLFELPYRGIVLTIPDESDVDTQAIDTNEIKKLLDDD